jgi:hypothetical protein
MSWGYKYYREERRKGKERRKEKREKREKKTSGGVPPDITPPSRCLGVRHSGVLNIPI